jgi:NAD(P)H-flavin reductase
LQDEAARHHLPARLRAISAARHSATQVLGRERARWKQAMSFIETFDQATSGQRQGSAIEHFDELFAAGPPQAVLCCGPQAFMQATAQDCVARGVAADRIWLSLERRMHCGVGLCGHCYIGSSYACVEGPTYRYDRYQQLLNEGANR